MAKWKRDNETKQYLCSKCNESPTLFTGVALGEQSLKEYRYCRFCGERITGITTVWWETKKEK